MANTVYTRFLQRLAIKQHDFSSSSDPNVVRCLLERSTSGYTVDKDHDTMADVVAGGLVECTAAGYSRQSAASKAVNIDDTNNWISLDFADLSFGTPAAGQIVKALIFFIQTAGGADVDATDYLICYIDTATGLPATLGGGAFTVTIHANGLITIA